ncbi:acyl carrier protein [Nocardiopsis sp. HNM0947]|uniref:Acyl carrier protein n=1 Tax=Nocardiopsis coralli TaxID=2772213 RepID=A0ABR9P147_9ACTN|nr:phosphopantetheine-binding protein [Nocardiopsis coralli]MBE2997578.1 acyl carrier protein [Nocardiopsis coralli]
MQQDTDPARQALTPEAVRAHAAEALGIPPEEIEEGVSLLDQGMDSIRLMSLVEKWREYGVETDFVALAEDPTLQAWNKLLTTG